VTDNAPYLQVPVAFWGKGYDEKVGIPGLAMMLAIAQNAPGLHFPAEWMPYGWSADTTLRGLKTLLDLGLVQRRERYKRAELTALGSTMFYEYRPKPVMRPRA
jgi:hypothetical protein